ncbi:MAG: glycosyltransferase family 2 protein [Deltaproteobacteria bacterium]|nr:glycosyltransferase family 2 protein [Deltaproteobacteria bacterium]MBW1816718.1 glycosyltransferase family 2 protein [Deltaproteobacteria bacterium]
MTKTVSILYMVVRLFYRTMGITVEPFYRIRSKTGSKIGVLENKREVPLIVSLTTIPSRINKVHLCIESILRQSLKPDRIILWISEKIDRDKIPVELEHLTKRGLQIRCCRDIGPYTKIFYTLQEHIGHIVVTADDDLFYPKNWLKKLYQAYRKEPEYIHCHRAHLMTWRSDGELKRYSDWVPGAPGITGPSLSLFPTGNGGILYPPGSLHKEVFNESEFMKLCPTADDIWLKAMALLNSVPCKKVAPHTRPFFRIPKSQSVSLMSQNIKQGKNDTQIRNVFERYELYRLF